MKPRDIILAIIALIVALFVIGILWKLTVFVIQIVVYLIIAYVIYLFLKNVL